MTIEPGVAKAYVKIRPPGRRWLAHFLKAAPFLVVAALLAAQGRLWYALFPLVFVAFYVHYGLVNLTSGVDLTPEFAVVPTLPRRRVPWLDVQTVVSHLNPDGTSAVWLVLAKGEPVKLRYPKSLWRKGDTRYETELQRIEHWWLEHRGGTWRPVLPESQQPPAS